MRPTHRTLDKLNKDFDPFPPGWEMVYVPSPLASVPLKNSLGIATFARASTANYTDRYGEWQTAAIDEPRFEAEGLLVEDEVTNMCLHSQDFTNGVWIGIPEILGQVEAPDGTITADNVHVEAGTVEAYQSILVADEWPYTFSYYISNNNMGDDNFNQYAIWDATHSTWIVPPTSDYNGVGGWDRKSIYFVTPLNCAEIWVYPIYTNGQTGTFDIWGAQLERLTFPSSYIATAAATMTRANDILSIPWYGNMPGGSDPFTVVIDFHVPYGMSPDPVDSPIRALFNIHTLVSGGGGSDDITAQFFHGTDNMYIKWPTRYIETGIKLIPGKQYRVCLTYDSHTIGAYENGVHDSDSVPSDHPEGEGDLIYIGMEKKTYDGLPGHNLFGHVSNFQIYDVALTATQVRTL